MNGYLTVIIRFNAGSSVEPNHRVVQNFGEVIQAFTCDSILMVANYMVFRYV